MKWDPIQYERFKQERLVPLHLLASLVTPQPDMRIVDLGCGTGEGTAWLHDHLNASQTLGIDSSQEMLSIARPLAHDSLSFACADISDFDPRGQFDLIFSNAALQWVPQPREVLERLVAGLPKGGQLAIQVPVQDDYPSHALAAKLAVSPPYKQALRGWVRKTHALDVRSYASILHELGMRNIHARVQVFGHELPNQDALLSWLQGSLLKAYQARLDPETFQAFLQDYAQGLAQALPNTSPFFFPFSRVLLHAVRL